MGGHKKRRDRTTEWENSIRRSTERMTGHEDTMRRQRGWQDEMIERTMLLNCREDDRSIKRWDDQTEMIQGTGKRQRETTEFEDMMEKRQTRRHNKRHMDIDRFILETGGHRKTTRWEGETTQGYGSRRQKRGHKMEDDKTRQQKKTVRWCRGRSPDSSSVSVSVSVSVPHQSSAGEAAEMLKSCVCREETQP